MYNPYIRFTKELSGQIRRFAKEAIRDLSEKKEKPQRWIDLLLPKLEQKYPGISFHKEKVELEVNSVLYSEVNRLMINYFDRLGGTEIKQLPIMILVHMIEKNYPAILFDEEAVKKEFLQVVSTKMQSLIRLHFAGINPEEDIMRSPLIDKLRLAMGNECLFLDANDFNRIALDLYIDYAAKKLNAFSKNIINPDDEQYKEQLTVFFVELVRAVDIDFRGCHFTDASIPLGKQALARIYNETVAIQQVGRTKYDRWKGM